jgi:hypothetical protein
MALTTTVLDGHLYDQLVAEPLDRIFIWIDKPVARERIARYFEHYLRGMSFAPGITHGDLSVSNVFVKENRISGIIDWDDARDNGILILDTINHLISRELHRLQRQAYAEVLHRLAFSTWLIKEEHDFLERMYSFCQVDPVHHPGLVYLNWLYTADVRLAEDAEQKTELVRRYVNEVIDLLDESGQLL